MKKENVSNIETNFLELNIKITDKMFRTKLYDKRDGFNFNICRLPFRCSNLPNKMFYSSISAEVLRICRATENLADVNHSVKLLLSRMFKQGALKDKLKVALTRTLNKHSSLIIKFRTTTSDMVNGFLN